MPSSADLGWIKVRWEIFADSFSVTHFESDEISVNV